MDRTKKKFYCAPMVRYSKIAFRQLVRLYDVDCCYTPMIYAKNFLESERCRSSEFSTLPEDRPLIVQFASNQPMVFAAAAELVYKYSSGVDLNCGCPKWDVRAKGLGCSLLKRPELLADMVKQTRARIPDPEYTISLKIRLNYPLDQTVDLCRKAEMAGVSHLTVHGRTPEMRCEPVDYDSIKVIKESVGIPVIANGNVRSRDQAIDIVESTGVDGIMAGQGLLNNPAMFAGYDYTPASCVRNFLRLSADHGLSLNLFNQHLSMMLHDVLTPTQRRVFQELWSRPAVEEFLENVLMINEIE